MNISKIIEQLTNLIAEWEILRRWNEYWQTLSQEHEQKCEGFLSQIYAFVSQNIKSHNWYHISIIKITNGNHSFTIPQAVGSIVEILKRLKSDIENWFLKWFESQISAEIFDNFLDHWEQYLNNDMKNEAGVIIGITFEDSIRKLARLIGINENWVKIDLIISQLQESNTISPIEAKRARSSAAVRTSAAHTRWEEFTKNDVESCLKFTKELISKMDNLQ
jgi:hypothetical protein